MCEQNIKTEDSGKHSAKARGIRLGPLLTDRGPDEMAKNVFRLLYCVGVKCSDIAQISVNADQGFARVDVRTAECENYLVEIFRDAASIMNQYDLRRITRDPRELVAARASDLGGRAIQDRPMQSTGSCLNADDKLLRVDFQRTALANQNKGASNTQHQQHQAYAKQTTNLGKHQIDEYGLSSEDTESASTSFLYSQCCFEHSESEQEKRVETIRRVTDAATCTHHSPPVMRNRKRLHNDKSERHSQKNSRKDSPANSACDNSQEPHHKEQQLFQYCSDTVRISDPRGGQKSSWQRLKKSQNSQGVSNIKTNSQFKTARPIQSAAAPISIAVSLAPNDENSPPPSGVIKLHAKTSTPAVASCGCPETVFYHHLQHIGAETRHAEFKRGGIVREQGAFRAVVGKYVCGFLNSEGGTLYFGVSDDGKVLGIHVDAALEETLRGDVDFAVRSLLEPSVDPAEYSVNFARVVEAPEAGGAVPQQQHQQLSEDLRVMEVCVKPRRPSRRRQRFSCEDVVYLRRDGSLQALGRAGRKAVQDRSPRQRKA